MHSQLQISESLAVIRFFSCSLEGRIIPRHKVLVENQINVKLKCMLACTDEEFDKMVKNIIRKRNKFQSSAMKANTAHPQSLITGDITTPET
jgi:mTERF domain-containing protein